MYYLHDIRIHLDNGVNWRYICITFLKRVSREHGHGNIAQMGRRSRNFAPQKNISNAKPRSRRGS